MIIMQYTQRFIALWLLLLFFMIDRFWFFVIMIVAANFYNNQFVLNKLSKYTHRDAKFYQKIDNVRANGGKIYLFDKTNAQLFYRAKYYLFEELEQLTDDMNINPQKDFVVSGNKKEQLKPVCNVLAKDDVRCIGNH